ncbi:hypothetical protein LINPERHAP1_LOCUS36369 [Linum perenne]
MRSRGFPLPIKALLNPGSASAKMISSRKLPMESVLSASLRLSRRSSANLG